MAWSVESLAFIPAGRPSSIPRGLKDFNLYPGTGCVSFVCVLSCIVSSGGSDILLTTGSERLAIVLLPSVLVHSLAILKASDPQKFGL